jgi:sterol desaturase/sphingolipid hydroxylase (fatty acid hydroxylase superfamily)
MNVHRLYRGTLARPLPAFTLQLGALALLWRVLPKVDIESSVTNTVALFIAGLGVWSFLEYAIHRWVMHSRIPAIWRALHADHHQMRQMIDPHHHVLHPLPAALIFGVVVWASAGIGLGAALGSGIWLGYLIYEAIHWVHHSPTLRPMAYRLRYFRVRGRYHVDHHFQQVRSNYGFTTTFWDRVFNTLSKPPALVKAKRLARRRQRTKPAAAKTSTRGPDQAMNAA